MNTSSYLRVLTILALGLVVVLPLAASASPPTAGAIFTVDTSLDKIDALPGDGICATQDGECSLRAAVMETNTLPGADTIRIPAGGPGLPAPSLTLTGSGEDSSLTGDLDVLDDLTISGDGMAVSGAEASALNDRALHVHSEAALVLSGVSFFWADAGEADGGGLLNEGVVTMVESSFQASRARTGAGVMNTGQLTLVRSVVGYNIASLSAGGILNLGTLTIDRSTIANNEVTAGPAGGIENRGTLTLRNSTVSQNLATDLAAGLHNASGAAAQINNATVYLNAIMNPSGTSGTGGILNEGTGSVRLSNSIVAVNAYGAALDEADCLGPIESAGYNLIGSPAGCTLAGDPTGNLVGVDPMLPPLPTIDPAQTWGYPPLEGSPVIDAGNPAPVGASETACETYDQAGAARPIGSRCDIGSHESEYGVGEVPTATLTATDTPPPASTPSPTPTPSPFPTATVLPGTVLFFDGFESGDLNAWSSALTDAGDLRVSRAAAIDGGFGLEAVIDDNRPIFVADDTPSSERTFRAQFGFDPRDLAIGRGKVVVLIQARDRTGLVAFQIELRAAAGDLEVRAAAPRAGGAAYTTPWTVLASGPHRLETLWWSASGVRAKDGGVEFFVDGVRAGGSAVLRNHGRHVDQVRLGFVTGATAFTRGICFFDTFVSTRGEPIEIIAPAH